MAEHAPQAAREGLRRLVELYAKHVKTYEDAAYNEESARADLIGPLFEALGWDVRNRAGAAEKYRDVTLNTGIKVRDSRKVPDYAFRIGGTRVFFVEAKKPALNLDQLAEPAHQLRSYARAVDLPLSVLTNFRQLAVYDTTVKPKPKDGAKAARILLVEWRDLPDKFEELWALLSKPAVLSGAIDRFAQSSTRAKGSMEIDDDFLVDLDRWRRELALAFESANPGLDATDLTEAVHKTLNRLVFLRFAEGRELEPHGQLRELVQQDKNYARMMELCRSADRRYNSGLFDLSADTLTPRLSLPDEALRNIVRGLYYPESPYIFSEMAPEVLGHAYERFLGNVIELKGGRPKIVVKPEVKKAGGVYYTPRYVVDFIVARTVGELCKGKSPTQLAHFRLVDPACGSGSFLLGALDYLFSHYLDWYEAHSPAKWPHCVVKEGGTWRLTTAEKGRIARTHVFGVDIDAQAVEVAKLSLLLKIIQGDTAATIDRQQQMFHEKALPSLEANVVSGNSVIGNEFFVRRGVAASESELSLVRPFDWNRRFRTVLREGGFDVVLGNPPYLNVDDTWGKGDVRLAALKELYGDVYNDKTDLLFYFLARGLQLTRGMTSFIVSRAFLEAFKADKLRAVLGPAIEQIVDFQNYQVFKGVGISTCIVVAKPGTKRRGVEVKRLLQRSLPSFELQKELANSHVFQQMDEARRALTSAPWNFASKTVKRLNEKIDRVGVELGSIVEIGQGMQTGLNEVFGARTQTELREWKVPRGAAFLRAANSDIEAFHIGARGEHLLYLENYSRWDDVPKGIQEHLLLNAKALKARAACRRGNCEWWKYTWPLHKDHYFKGGRIVSPFISPTNRFALDEADQFLSLTDTTVVFAGGLAEGAYYLLGLLNSRVLTFRFRTIGKLKGGDQYEYFWNSVSRLPIRRINASVTKERRAHESIVKSVKQAMELRSRVDSMSSAAAAAATGQLDAIRDYIDDQIADLYGISKAERSELIGGQS